LSIAAAHETAHASLLGREGERAVLDGLVAGAREGRSGALVLRGEAGIGKSALLDYAAARAHDVTVVRALGVESEAELEFSALLDVCRPLLDWLAYLPARQADALRGALGLGPCRPVDRFAIGAATLNLLATASAQAPVLVLVDDAQWLDRSSADALLFAARRLDRERVAVVLAAREDDAGPRFEAPGLDSLALGGLGEDAIAELLGATPEVASAVRAATAGNPLATLEVRPSLTAAQLAGLEPLVDPLPAGATMERAFAARAASLPHHARTALLVAAVSPSTGLGPVVAALAELGAGPAALEQAEDAGLIRIELDRVAFRHPLVRSAVFHAASPSERRAAHRALAGSTRDDERAWHLAGAALGPDEEAAAALAEAARRTRARSGYAGAASALERAARLTPDAADRRARLQEAAEAAWLAGRRDAGIALVEEALDGAADPLERARMLHLRGHIERLAGNLAEAIDLLREAATLAEPVDPATAVTMLGEAATAALHAGLPAAALDAGERARALAPADGSAADFQADFALAQALYANGRAAEGEPRLERMLRALAARPGVDDPVDLILGSIAAAFVDRAEHGLELAERAIALAREQGAYASLHRALGAAGANARRLGRWDEAYAYTSEALALARESGQTTIVAHTLTHLAFIDAARGDEARTRAHIGEALELGERLGVTADWPERALALLELTLGRFEEAAARLERLELSAVEHGSTADGADLVEAYVRLGDEERARTAFSRRESYGPRAGAADAGASAARCRGLLAGDDEFEAHFRDALALHEQAADAFAAARTRLALGERLRRAGRRIDAREELRAALDAFTALGAEPWAGRARAELQASGATLRRRAAHEGEELTPQERQIAAHVAQGKTNKEVAAALFLSHKTVDFHLGRVYRKLNVRSRGELILHFAAA
jgi:DNA-binding CsgD family transcriptional regulator